MACSSVDCIHMHILPAPRCAKYQKIDPGVALLYCGMERYVDLKIYGACEWFNIVKARDSTDGTKVVIKRVSKGVEEAQSERNSLTKLKHPNIIQVIDLQQNEKDTTFILEYGGKNLLHFVDDLGAILEPYKSSQHMEKVMCIMYQILQGVAHIHEQDVLHLDLKPDNILMHKTGRIRICDFGLSELMEGAGSKSTTEEKVTLWYRPPELFMKNKLLSTAADMWSIGAIFGGLLNGKVLFKALSCFAQLLAIKQYIFSLTTSHTWWSIFRILGPPDDEALKYYQNPLDRFVYDALSSDDKSSAAPMTLEAHLPDLDPKALDLLKVYTLLVPHPVFISN